MLKPMDPLADTRSITTTGGPVAMVRTSFSQLRPQQSTSTKEAQSRTPMAKMSKEKILEIYGVDVRHQELTEAGRRRWTDEQKKQVLAAIRSRKWPKGEIYDVLGLYSNIVLTWDAQFPEEDEAPTPRTKGLQQQDLLDTDEDDDTDTGVSQESDQGELRAQALSLVNPVGPRIAAGQLAKRAQRRQSRLEHQNTVMEVDSARAIKFSVSSPEQAIRMLELLQANTMDISRVTITIDVIED